MPRISAFYGLIITMYYSDHAPPHFHAEYAENRAKLHIGSGALIAGSLPPRALALVREWEELRRAELLANWQRAELMQPLAAVAPLD
jgi:hypothetical protein